MIRNHIRILGPISILNGENSLPPNPFHHGKSKDKSVKGQKMWYMKTD
jgi:hypothetical protein